MILDCWDIEGLKNATYDMALCCILHMSIHKSLFHIAKSIKSTQGMNCLQICHILLYLLCKCCTTTMIFLTGLLSTSHRVAVFSKQCCDNCAQFWWKETSPR